MAKPIILEREELYREVWSTPMRTLAPKYGLSDSGLAKICRRMDVPRPERGYWAKIQNGWHPKQEALKPLSKNGLAEVTIYDRSTDIKPRSAKLQKVEKAESTPKNKIIVQEKLLDKHLLIAKTKSLLSDLKLDRYGCLNAQHWGGANIRASQQNMNRALRIMNSLFRALEKRGCPIVIVEEKKPKTCAVVEEEKIEFHLEELVKQSEHIPTPKELEEQKQRHWRSWQRYDYTPTNIFTLHISDRAGYFIEKRKWQDTKKVPLEDCLNDFILGLHDAAEFLKRERERRRNEEKQWLENEELRKQRKRLREAEESKIKQLDAEISGWHKSQTIRAYLDIVRKNKLQPDETQLEWLKWVEQYADHIDPLTDYRIEILDEN